MIAWVNVWSQVMKVLDLKPEICTLYLEQPERTGTVLTVKLVARYDDLLWYLLCALDLIC